ANAVTGELVGVLHSAGAGNTIIVEVQPGFGLELLNNGAVVSSIPVGIPGELVYFQHWRGEGKQQWQPVAFDRTSPVLDARYLAQGIFNQQATTTSRVLILKSIAGATVPVAEHLPSGSNNPTWQIEPDGSFLFIASSVTLSGKNGSG